MTRHPVCSDSWQGHRKCTLPPHSKDLAHSDGKRYWWSSDPTWRKWTLEHLNAKELAR